MSNYSDCIGLLCPLEKIQKLALTLHCLFFSSIFYSYEAVAQIIPDDKLTSPSVTIPSGNIIEIQGGTKVGTNLFHSFEQFSVTTGTTAFFNNPLDVANIISRVTGGSISQIDGLIRANGTANLFLINPNGIIFGPNASLNIGGSFLASTAESIKLADGSFFSAVNPQNPPLLTINTPVGLQYGSNPGKITVQGQGNKLFFDEFTFATVRDNRPVGLQVTSGKTLALVGGQISLEGGNLTAAEGRIEVGSVQDSGFVSLNTSNSGLTLGYEGVNNFSDINLSAAASIDVSGQGGGNVQVVGRNIKLSDGSAILANTEGNITGGTLNIKASQALEMSGISADLPFSTTISADVSPTGTANAGKISIDTKSLIVSDGAQISTNTFGLGTGGTINVKSQDIQLISGSDYGPSGLFANTDGGMGTGGSIFVETDKLVVTDAAKIGTNSFSSGNGGDITVFAKDVQLIGTAFGQYPSGLSAYSYSGNGNGGNIKLITQNLKIQDGAQIETSTFSSGNAGKLEVEADNIELSGLVASSKKNLPSGLFANTSSNLTGNGGLLSVKTNSLRILDGAQIAATTFGTGNAGKIEIQAQDIELKGAVNSFPSGIVAQVGRTAIGKGGDLNIMTQTLRLSDGAQILTNTLGKGDAGSLTVQANNIDLSGFATGGSSGLLSNALRNNGNGGNLTIATDKLTIINGATIAVGNFSSRDSSIPPGQGLAGNIQIDARLLELFDNISSSIPSSINASTLNGGGGNIQLNIKEAIVASNSSQVIAETRGNANGGTIRVNTNLLALNSGANLSTNSTGLGQAGEIFINAEQIRANQGLITAKAAQAGGGNININTNLLYLKNNSLISTSVTDSTGGGGNITFNGGFIVSNNNSDIRANAIFGPGGNILIQSQGIFLYQDSEIDASSKFGLDGEVKITNPDGVEKIAAVELPANIVDGSKLIAASCSSTSENEFVLTGKGGLPENPTETIRGQTVWLDLRPLSVSSSKKDKLAAARQQTLPQMYQQQQSQIIEAQAWIINSDGKIELVAHIPNQIPQASLNAIAKCQ